MRTNHRLILIPLLVTLFLSGGCSGAGSSDAPASAIQAYFQALVNQDADRLVSASCAAWESQARLELNSFGAVETQLENPACQSQSEEGDYTLVSCTGQIQANYGAEVLTINLGDRQYLAIYEGDQWRMCGYR